MNQQDYSDTILHVFVNSTDASFKITEMPEGVFDLIFIRNNATSFLLKNLKNEKLKTEGNNVTGLMILAPDTESTLLPNEYFK